MAVNSPGMRLYRCLCWSSFGHASLLCTILLEICAKEVILFASFVHEAMQLLLVYVVHYLNF